MDFHALPRRDLQFLCKKNKIPANMTNVAMADALKALQMVEGIDEMMKEALKLESPKKEEVGSPELQRTSRRASARRAPAVEEPKGTQGSPLPRSRRVTAKTLEIMHLVDGDGVEEEEKQGGKKEMPKTPAVALRSSRKPQGTASRRAGKKGESGAEEIAETPAASSARTTRRRATKKEEQEGIEGVAVEVPLRTPATRGGRRTAARKAAEAPTAEEDEAAGASRTTARRTRQTARKVAAESAAALTTGRRVTRAMAAAKMAELDREEEEEEDNDGGKGIDDPNNGSPQVSDEKSDSLKDVKVLDSKGTSGEKMDGFEGILNESNEEVVSEEVSERERDREKDWSDPLSGLQGSPIRGLVSEMDPLSLCDEIAEQSLDASITDLVPLGSHPTDERRGGNGEVAKADSEEEGGSGEVLDEARNDDLLLLVSSNQMGGNSQDGDEDKEESSDSKVLNLPLQDSAETEAINGSSPEINLLPANEGPAETKVSEDSGGLLEIASISREALPETVAESSIVMDDASSSSDPTGSLAKTEGMPEELINPLVKSSPLVRDSTGEIIDSVIRFLVNTSTDTGDLVENTFDSSFVVEASEAQTLDSSDCTAENTVEIALKVEGFEEKSEEKRRVSVAIYEEASADDNTDKENKVADLSTTVVGFESGEAKPQFKAEGQNLPKAADLHSLSLRKLRVMYKEKLINMNNNTKVMEGKRLALAELNENLQS